MVEKLLSKSICVMPERFRHYYYYRMLRSIAFPEIVHIENTNACNARCIMCPRDIMQREIGFMDFGLFKKLIDECSGYKELKEVHLHGFGEPLMDRMLIDRIRYAKENKIKKVYFVTNASLLDKEYSRNLLEAGIDMIKFSVYGNSPQTYEAIHKGLKFHTVEKNILGFLEVRRRMGRRKPSIKIQFLPYDINLHERADFINKWSSLIDKTCGDSVGEFPIHNWIYGRRYHCQAELDSKVRKSCGIPFVSLQVLWNGHVTACCYDYEGRMGFGNVARESLGEIWNSKAYKIFRVHHRAGNFEPIPICKACDQLRPNLL